MEGIHKIGLDTQYVIHLCLAHTQRHTLAAKSYKETNLRRLCYYYYYGILLRSFKVKAHYFFK